MVAERTLKVRGVAYHLSEVGQGSPLLMLHGFTGSGEIFLPLAPRLPRFRLLLPDLLGHGMTEVPRSAERYRMEEAIEDLAGLLEGLSLEQVDLFGYSMGGRLALGFALSYPQRVRCLVLESASPGLEDPAERALRRSADEALAARIEAEPLEAFVRTWEAQPLFSGKPLDPELALLQRKIRLSAQPHGLAGSLRGLGVGVQPSYWDRLGELRLPVLLLTGALDTKFVHIAWKMLQRLPQARHHSFPGCAHTPHLEDPAAFAEVLREFLSGPL
jgi:2-succinyl-6-hydroxy-2,4-cyclohexadiene-1-carboxylate synthase